MVGRLVAAKGRDDAEGDADDRGEEDRVERQLGGRRDELAQVVRHGVVGQRRLAEVALEQVLEVDQVALRERLVQPVVLLERRDRGGVAGGLLAEVRRGGVARDELGQDERDQRDPEQEEDERGQPPREEAEEPDREEAAPPPRGAGRPDGHGGHRRSPDLAPKNGTGEARTIEAMVASSAWLQPPLAPTSPWSERA